MNVCPGSTFCEKYPGRDLPTPAEVRAMAATVDGHNQRNVWRPPPVKFPLLGVLVKYGMGIKVTEARTQIFVREKLHGRVPIPEVFGWTEDGRQVFIYMTLIEGDALEERWLNMNEIERLAVCKSLRDMANAWKTLSPEGEGEEEKDYIGSLHGQPLEDIFFLHRPAFQGPFRGASAVEDLQRACHIYMSGHKGIAFTHNDLIPPNILLTRGPNPEVAAIIDWAQSGWYPAYWEFCKSREVDLNPEKFSWELQREWKEKYLPTILDPVDDETCYYPFRYFVISHGI